MIHCHAEAMLPEPWTSTTRCTRLSKSLLINLYPPSQDAVHPHSSATIASRCESRPFHQLYPRCHGMQYDQERGMIRAKSCHCCFGTATTAAFCLMEAILCRCRGNRAWTDKIRKLYSSWQGPGKQRRTMSEFQRDDTASWTHRRSAGAGARQAGFHHSKSRHTPAGADSLASAGQLPDLCPAGFHYSARCGLDAELGFLRLQPRGALRETSVEVTTEQRVTMADKLQDAGLIKYKWFSSSTPGSHADKSRHRHPIHTEYRGWITGRSPGKMHNSTQHLTMARAITITIPELYRAANHPSAGEKNVNTEENLLKAVRLPHAIQLHQQQFRRPSSRLENTCSQTPMSSTRIAMPECSR